MLGDRRLLLLLALLVAAGALFLFRARGAVRPPGPLPVVPCAVTIADPASGVALVRLEFDEEALAGRRELLFAFADVRGRRTMLRAFAAELDGTPAPTTAETYRGSLVQH